MRLVLAFGALGLAAPGWAQYREYYVRGRVLDTQKKPITGVEIHLRDAATSRDYHLKTDKDGAFKLAGLPHGLYEVTYAKEGYESKQDQWKFESPQETMQKVDVPDVVLASQSLIQQVERQKEAESGLKEAAENIRKGDPDGAIALLKGVLDKDPNDANALFFMGLAYVNKKMCREAIEALTRVTVLTPAFAGAYFELGVCYGQMDDLPKALEAYGKNMELDPANADSAYNSGLILFQTNRIDEALARFEHGLDLKPGDPDLLEMAGRCYIHEGKLEAAVEHLEKARAAITDPAKAAFLDEMIGKVKAQIK